MPGHAEPLLLLLEDNPDDVALARRALRDASGPVRLQVAESVQEGLNLLTGPEAQRPRAIFMDINMPERNGFDFLRAVRAAQHLKTLPVVVLTTSSRPEDIENSYRLGANSYVTKPLDFREFVDVFASMSKYWLQVNHIPS